MPADKGTLDGLKIDRSRAPRNRSLGWLGPLIVLFLLAGGVTAWMLRRPTSLPVRSVPAKESVAGEARTLLNASGYVTARRQATVSSKVTGKVVEVLVEEGLKVEAGQVLARLDASNVEASLRLAEAQENAARKSLAETQATLAQAEREWQRVTRLGETGIASAAELDRAEADAKTLRARLERQTAEVAVAEREVAIWKQQLDDTVVRAPFSGIVTVKNAQPGEMISPVSAGGGFTRTGICTLVDMASLEIEVDVSESYLNRVAAGQTVEATLDSYPDWRMPAKVIAIIPAADRQKATVKVRVGFEQLDPRILPDMGVKVAFRAAPKEADTATAAATPTRLTLIPKTAVRQLDGRDTVWVVRDGRAERRAITLDSARTSGDEVAVAAGLTAGERVVVQGADALTDGARITETTP